MCGNPIYLSITLYTANLFFRKFNAAVYSLSIKTM